MKPAFIGADRKVTGGCHFLEAGAPGVLVDCGMEQGNNVYQNVELPVSYREADYIFLAHAHIDRTGMLPWIYAKGFKGQVITTHATVDLCNIVLKDNAHIQEMEAEWKNRRTRRTSRMKVEALYTMEGARSVLKHFEGAAHGQKSKLNNDPTLRFTDMGHLLGSASIEIWATEDKKTKKIVFFGDINNKNKPLIRDPQCISEADHVVMEFTYDNRYHKKDVNHVESLARIIRGTLDHSGNAVIPASVVGRTQELPYLIRHTKDERLIQGHDGFEVYVDSPLAVGATHVFKENMMECYDAETKALAERGIDPIDFPELKLSIASEESKNINLDMTSKVIIFTTDMCDAGRARHHLKRNLWRQECSIVLADYQAEGILGRVLQDGVQTVKIFDKEIGIRARIETMGGINGHADRDGLVTWISSFGKRPGYVFVVHGDEEFCTSFVDVLNTQLKLAARAPYSGPRYDLTKGCWIEEAEPVPTEKETAARRKATSVYTRLVDAGRLLIDMVNRNQGGINRDLVCSAEQILVLYNKWDR